MATLQELMAQREALEQQIEHTKKQERAEAIEKVRTLMAEYGLTLADLGGTRRHRQAEENQVERKQGRREIPQRLDRRNLERPRACSRAG